MNLLTSTQNWKKLQKDLSHADKNITDIQKEMELKTSIADFEKFRGGHVSSS